ncbi:Rhodanese-related sulfurtransferase [Hyella patelloides LEGE 07179]|uniref:Rhodanese-related sulfurtransferase n=1 Tax=Hyella patelloides LEGE 07179 TaxID=945734 RepID=A0A563VXJ3_9CYAN|nr:rhodanese-like domain-containing protein [Hyella patelloides]VEP16168.1 Rhodanese-related sulfurtransferase [Hyella patelloides LEGE 07179]
MSNSSRIIPEPLKTQSLVSDLKKRLDWGEPALTIIDIRDRDAFNTSHISGAISLPINSLVDRTLINLELTRDLYLYGSTDEQTASAAAQLRTVGYQNVAEVKGGLAAWKASSYPIEGNSTKVA